MLGDFLSGRSNKLARDFLLTAFVIVGLCMAGFGGVKYMLNEVKLAQAERMPPRIQNPQGVTTTVVTRSVLDDVVSTGSIGGRSVILDPCTGKEKK